MEQQEPRNPRKSLTRKQLEEPEALELLALLQTVTEDGRVLDEEIAALNEWLSDNAGSTLPAITYLRESVEAVLEDGRVSIEERAWLQKAVETVLPREEREFAAMRRREAKADDRRAAADEQALERELAKKSRPIASFDFMVAGVHHEGRAEIVRSHCRAHYDAFLVREPDNRYSRNATLVRLANGLDIGYVPESDAVHLAPILDGGALQAAAIKKILSVGRVPIPVIWGELYASDAPVPEAIPMSEAPSPAKSEGSYGWLIAVVLILAVFLLALLL